MDALTHGYTAVVVRTIDTDVLVLFISILGAELDGSSNIFAAMISPHSTKYFKIMENAIRMGPKTCEAFRFFYAFTGCVTVSSIFSKGMYGKTTSKKMALHMCSLP